MRANPSKTLVLTIAVLTVSSAAFQGCAFRTGGTYDDAGDNVDVAADAPELVDLIIGDRDVPRTCGDGEVDEDEGEQCDDGNDIDGDGCDNDCTWSCRISADCDDDNSCNGKETCDALDTHTCLAGENADGGKQCDDGLHCTMVDECDGDGECIGIGSPCDAVLDCIEGFTCVEETDTYACMYDIVEDYCYIEKACYNDMEPNPANACLECRVGGSDTEWTELAEGGECGDDGICCGGECREGGDCCDNTYCFAGCVGTARWCGSFGSGTCATQAGCRWDPLDGCKGDPGTCAGMDPLYCGACGCTSIDITCGGYAYNCDFFAVEGTCTSCGCTWGPLSEGACAGTPDSCAGHGEGDCTSDCGCAWVVDECFGISACGMFADASTCRACGCDWRMPCAGAHDACDTFGEEGKCVEQLDCHWSVCEDYSCT